VVLARPCADPARILTVWRQVSRRRALAVAWLSLLVALDVVLWFSLSDSGGGADRASPEAAPASAGRPSSTKGSDASLNRSTGRVKPSGSEPSATATSRDRAFTCRLAAATADRLETVKVSGRYAGHPPGTELHVQLQRDGRWVDFPLPTVVLASGRYTTFVQVGQLGSNKLRVVDPASGDVSNTVTLVVR
jgi:hypothetical protein